MGKKKQVLVTIDNGDEGIVTKDRDLTQGEIDEIYDKARSMSNNKVKLSEDISEEPSSAKPHMKGILKLKCQCGRVTNISDEVIEDGLSWSMIIGNDHFLTLHCDECGSELTMFIEEIVGDELPKESN
jgi:predicted nucleic-acid-binding Zn-ribbon protein